MNGIYQLCALALCFTCLGTVVAKLHPDMMPLYKTAVGVVCMLYLVSMLEPVADYIKRLTGDSALPSFFSVLIKSVGIALLCGSAADICRDCGDTALGAKVETAGKAMIILLSLPVLKYLLDSATSLM